jgi:misacylated tRNA(Ala) deacylase
VKGILDWEKRFAHMRMHTAQHLISAMVYDTYGARTVGNQIYADRSRIDFEPLDHEKADMSLIEERMNEFVKAGYPVVITQEKRSELEKVVDCKKCNLDLLPSAIQDLRIVRVGGVDVCPCAGTHVRGTSELGTVKLLKKENKGKDRVRITYELLL